MSDYDFTLELGGISAEVSVNYTQECWKANEYEPAGADDPVIKSVEVLFKDRTSDWVHDNVSDEFLAEAINTSGFFSGIEAKHISYGGTEEPAPEVIRGTMAALNKLSIRGGS